MSFLKAQVSFPSNVASVFSAIKHNSSILFLAQTLCTLVKTSPLKCKFLRFLSPRVKIVKFLMPILKWQINSISNFASFFIVITHNCPLNFKLIHFLLCLKDRMKVPVLRISCALVKICQYPHVILQPNHKSVFLQILHHTRVS